MFNLSKEISQCLNEKELIELLKNTRISPDIETIFSDKKLIFYDSHYNLSSIDLPDNDFGLAAKVVSSLKFHGYLGHQNYSGGALAHLGKYRTLWNDFIRLKDINSFREIDSELIEAWIRNQLDQNLNPISIMRKLNRLIDWQNASPYLPEFLLLDFVNIYECPSYLELKNKHDFMNRNREENSNFDKTKYPLHLLLPILKEAITYIENYTKDIELLMENREYLLSNQQNSHNIIHRFIQSQEYQFQEPSLKNMQKICLSTNFASWQFEQFPEKKGPRSIIYNAVDRWQAANLIILGFFTASRSNEISRQIRNIQVKKTKYHEIDKGYNYTRIAWKTSAKGKIITTPLPPIGLKAYQNLSHHSVLCDGKETGVLIFKGYNSNSIQYSDRMNYVLKKFSYWVHDDEEQPLTSHQLRHAMASLMSHLNDHNGLMIVAKLLGHESIAMSMDYQSQLKNIVLKQIEFIGETNIEVGTSFKEFKEEESMRVLDNTILPALKNGKVFVGAAKDFVDFSGDIINDVDSWYKFHSDAIKAGEEIIMQGSVCLCVHSTKNPKQMACQRGINIENYIGVPPQISACKGSSCPSSLFTEDACERLLNQSKSVKDLAPKDLQELAKDWFYAIGDVLDIPDQQILDEYIDLKKNKQTIKSYKEVI